MISVLKEHTSGIVDARFSADGTTLVTASKDFTARIWDTKTGLILGELCGHKDWVNNAAFSPDGSLVVTASRNGTALVWECSAKGKCNITSRLFGHRFDVKAQFSPDGKFVVTASRDGMARVWQLKDLALPSQDMASAFGSPVADCEICWPSCEEICTLAAERVASPHPQLQKLVRNKFLRSHELHYKILSFLGGLWRHKGKSAKAKDLSGVLQSK